MILKGLPESYGPFAVHVTQSDVNTSFAEFKTKLRRYEATEKMRTTGSDDNVMKGRMQPASASISDRGAESGDKKRRRKTLAAKLPEVLLFLLFDLVNRGTPR